MEKFNVIKLTTKGCYSSGIHKAENGNSALMKALKKLRGLKGMEYDDFIVFVQHIKPGR